jgi:hypothetical protein
MLQNLFRCPQRSVFKKKNVSTQRDDASVYWARNLFETSASRVTEGAETRARKVGVTVMENESITSAFSREHSGHKPPTVFWGLMAVIVMIAAIYFLMFRDVPLRPL